MNPQNIADIYKLSPTQEAMLFHTLVAPESGVFFEQMSRYFPKLDVPKYVRAWQLLIDRHTALRTAFFWEGMEEPLQVVNRTVELPVEELDWRDVAESDRLDRLKGLMAQDRETGFDLTEAPLYRLLICRLSEEAYYVVISYHHIIMDGWSAFVLGSEVTALYKSMLSGQMAQLPPPRPFRDYITWLGQQNMGDAADFWKSQVEDWFAPTSLPVLSRSGGMVDGYGLHQEFEIGLSAETQANIQRTVKESRTTIHTLVQAAWTLLLARYNDNDDVMFGMVVHGRPLAFSDFDSLVGLYINVLPVRSRLPFSTPVSEWIQQFQNHLRTLAKYEYYPLAHMQQWSQVPRQRNLFDSVFIDQMTRGEQAGGDGDGGDGSEEVLFAEKSNFPLTLYLRDTNALQIDYDTTRLTPELVADIGRNLVHILDQLTTQPDLPVSQIMLQAPAMSQRPLAPAIEHPIDIITQIELQASRMPEKKAVICRDHYLTFGELDARSNQLARWLNQRGIGCDDTVGIYFERSVEMILAMIGIMKAGAAYVPLNTVDPHERLNRIMKTADLRCILTAEAKRDFLAPLMVDLLAFDSEWEKEVSGFSAETIPNKQAIPHQTAYTIYTSGSTGEPKGVMVTRRNLSSFATAGIAENEFSPADTLLQFANITFDTSVEEIFPGLAAGATLVIRTPEMFDSVSVFVQALHENAITSVNFATAYWHLLVEEIAAGTVTLPNTIRHFIVGGEAALPERVEQWRQFAPKSIRMVNTYGPTEATVAITSFDISSDYPIQDAVPIGVSYDSGRAYVLDSQLRPVPVGVPGELYLGGAAVARGYRLRPSRTATSFVPNPYFGPDFPYPRLYRTGDKVRINKDHLIEYLGRTDLQVKVRGFRVELGEIERCLLKHADVVEAVVVQHENGQLTAYLQAVGIDEEKVTLEPAALLAVAQQQLPAYMVPSAFVQVDGYPLTRRNKIDRKKLADQDAPLVEDDAFAEPETEIETALAEIWSKLLKVEQIGVFTDFFRLGGHSLLATQLVQRINTRFPVDLTIRDVFEEPTVAQQALLIEERLFAVLQEA